MFETQGSHAEVFADSQGSNASGFRNVEHVFVTRNDDGAISANRAFEDHVIFRVATYSGESSLRRYLLGNCQITAQDCTHVLQRPSEFGKESRRDFANDVIADCDLVKDESYIQRGLWCTGKVKS